MGSFRGDRRVKVRIERREVDLHAVQAKVGEVKKQSERSTELYGKKLTNGFGRLLSIALRCPHFAPSTVEDPPYSIPNSIQAVIKEHHD